MTYYILYTYTIPISLFISLEIVRIIQSLLISHDQNLKFTIPTGEEVSAKARNSNLNEDLGKIQHIFSDKTGTLTQNMMQLSYWYVSGTIFDEMANPGALGGAIKVFVVSVLVFIAIVVKYSQSSETPPEKREQLKQFARHVAVCHTTLTTRSDKTNEIVYEAESPDESALLNALRPSGLLLASRSKTEIILDNDGQSESFEVLELIEFNSDRKRMTVIVRVGKEIHLYCKGADSIIMKRLKKDHDRTVIEDFDRQLVEFSNRGLRTLLFAWRVISEEEYLIFRQRFDEASSALQSREQKMSDAASEIEQNMSLIGCSAIEDKLQDQVPETIDYLLNCGIKVWVLTGDKRETAINIAKSCKLFSSNTVLLSGDFDDDQACQVAFNQYQNMLDRLMVGQRAALVITGDSLRVALESRAEQFLQLANRCHSVLCCRVTPLQKAAVVSLVRQTSKKVVLSVGDGANDVPMIQAANVGVGIVGMEGAQAVRASDYSIGQFRGLRRLIAVHGRYFKLGITEMIYFSLYKNIAQITVCFWFGLHSAWSGLVSSSFFRI
jgi:phospholipid-translocating P-type ATPase (flippase)